MVLRHGRSTPTRFHRLQAGSVFVSKPGLISVSDIAVEGVISQGGFKNLQNRSRRRQSAHFSSIIGVLGSLAQADVLRCCIESTGAYHIPVLRAWKAIPCVVNPLLAPDRRKTDVLDARILAHHSITGIWKPSLIPTESAQVLRVLWAARGEAVHAATRASNRLNKYGIGYTGSQSAVAAKRSAGALHNISSRQVIVALRHGPCYPRLSCLGYCHSYLTFPRCRPMHCVS